MSLFKSLKSKINLIGLPIENECSVEKWEAFEKAYKVNLPLDYKKYIHTYGTGCLSELIWVLNPFSNIPRFNTISFLEEKKKAFLIFEKITKKTYPYQLFREGHGILPFGFTDNGDTFYWEIKTNKSEQVNILIFDSRELLIEKYQLSFSHFLLEILNRSIESTIINIDDINGNIFSPVSY